MRGFLIRGPCAPTEFAKAAVVSMAGTEAPDAAPLPGQPPRHKTFDEGGVAREAKREMEMKMASDPAYR